MLGLPVSSAMAGFVPSTLMFVLSWAFMMVTGLLLLEVNLYFREDVNLITMADKTLGKFGQGTAWFLFLFLFYSIMVAYSAGSGELIADFVEETTKIVIPAWAGSLIFVGLFGLIVYFGTFAVDGMNRLLMAGLLITYFMLLALGFPHISNKLLQQIDWSESLWVVPIMIISFGYHNLVPSLTTYLQFDAKKMRLSIIVGSALPLVAYLLWEWLILGLIPLEEFQQAASQGNMVTHTLKKVAGGKLWVVDVAQYFAFFAIVTSFIGVALSFVDFLADGFQIKKDHKGRALTCTMVLVPPLFFAVLYPAIFVKALQYAGGFGAVVLFGILPALMAWSGRYRKKLWTTTMVPGGRLLLLLVIFFAGGVFLLQLSNVLYFHR
jgi:tyrosine-specific transport protein